MTARGMLGRVRQVDPVMLWGFGFAAVIFVFTVLNLATRSMWWDELFAMSLADPATPSADAIQQIREDVHLPGYFWGLRMWLDLWNTSSDYAARAFNLLPFAFAAWMAARSLGQQSTQPRALWIVLFFSAFGVYWYLQDARMYTMMIMQSLCGCLVVLDFQKRRLEKLTPAYVAILVVTFLLLPLGHWFSLGFAGCLLLALFGWSLLEKRVAYAATFFVLGIALGGFGLGWLIANAGATVGAMDDYGTWVYGGTLSFYGLRITAVGTLLHSLTLNPILILAAGLGMWRIVTAPWRHVGEAIILGSCIALSLAILGVSLIAAMYQIRNFVWLIAPMTLFAAMGLQVGFEWIKLTRMGQAAATIAILLLSVAIAPFGGKLSELEVYDWRSPGKFVSTLPGCENTQIRATAYWVGPTPTPLEMRYSKRIAGFYAGGPERIEPIWRNQKVAINETSPCPVVLWIVEYPETAYRVAREVIGPEFERLETRIFEGHTIFLRPQSAQVAGK